MRPVVVVTRGSLLARTQTGHVVAALSAAWPEHVFDTTTLTTQGDRRQDAPLPQIGGQGVFTGELEQALVAGRADCAVHSLKDLPTQLAAGLALAAVPAREEARDALVLPSGVTPPVDTAGVLGLLPVGARVGTSSLRRQAWLRHQRPDLRLEPVRGNLDTRLRKLDEGTYDALVLAAAGLHRLGWAERITGLLPLDEFIPAPGQGALAVQGRTDDAAVLALLAALEHPPTRAAVTAERAFLAAFGAGCQLPLGAHAEVVGDGLVLRVAVAPADGSELLTRTAVAPLAQAAELGRSLAAALRAEGAERLLGR